MQIKYKNGRLNTNTNIVTNGIYITSSLNGFLTKSLWITDSLLERGSVNKALNDLVLRINKKEGWKQIILRMIEYIKSEIHKTHS